MRGQFGVLVNGDKTVAVGEQQLSGCDWPILHLVY